MTLVAIILSFNEELHISRCICSLKNAVTDILVVDCYSTDRTVAIAESLGARGVQHEWLNYASQFNWALTQLAEDIDWVLRIDADEVLSIDLVKQIHTSLPSLDSSVNGVYWQRRMTFQGRLIRHGGVFPIQVLRLFRYGQGHCENRWMDEHIKVTGKTINFNGEMIDDNLNSLTWWVDKHNKYASREAIDLLNLKYRFMPHDSVANLKGGEQVGVKRWLKEEVYARLPEGFRALGYFFYRYVLRFGFLDGRAGAIFHFLQGFWYRYLVDAKLAEVDRYMREHDVDLKFAIHKVLDIKI